MSFGTEYPHDPDDDEAPLSMLWAYAAGALSAAGVPEKVKQSLGDLGSNALDAHRKLRWFKDNFPKTWDDELTGCRTCSAAPGDEHFPTCEYLAHGGR